MNEAIISIGSNIEPEKHILEVQEAISSKWPGAQFADALKTEPIGSENSHYYVNTACKLQTSLTMEQLESECKHIESLLGRVRDPQNKFADRTMDLDIILWNGKIIDEDVHTREFLKKFIHELAPGVLKKD